MAWIALRHFLDLQDNRYSYGVGDQYPRSGYEPTEKRILELAGTENRRGVPLIAEVLKEENPAEAPVTEPPKKRGRKPKAEE